MRKENPPFGRGETFYNGETIDSNDYKGTELEGQEYEFADYDYSATGVKTLRSDRIVRCRVVRNVGAVALLPKEVVRFQESGLYYGQRVDGKVAVTNKRGYPVDEFLPAAGVPVGDLFYIVVDGPAMVTTPMAGAEFNGEIAVGDKLVALTAATSGATTAGRVARVNTTASTQTADYSAIVEAAQNYIGHALSAKTTGNTNADVLIDVGKW